MARVLHDARRPRGGRPLRRERPRRELHRSSSSTAGELDIVFAVDMFNEGVDLPTLDTVMMLRPTESKILWLQQFGRGLRKAAGKERLTVIDYIGNHRVFLLSRRRCSACRPATGRCFNLLERLRAGNAGAAAWLRGHLRAGGHRDPARPSQASRRAQATRSSGTTRTSRSCTACGRLRSRLIEDGYNPRAVRERSGSWLGSSRSHGRSRRQSQRPRSRHHGAFIDALDTTQMMKSYKMLVLLGDAERGRVSRARSASTSLADEVAALATRTTRAGADLGAALRTTSRR